MAAEKLMLFTHTADKSSYQGFYILILLNLA